MSRTCFYFILSLELLLCSARGAFTVRAEPDRLEFRFDKADTNRTLVELAPFETIDQVPGRAALAYPVGKKDFFIPRFEGQRDRLYSGFAALHEGKPEGGIRYVEIWKNISKYQTPYPVTRSKKGLQIQMVDDAVALGVQHAGFNFDIGPSVKLTAASNDLPWKMDGRTFWFDHNYIEDLDRKTKTISDTGADVTLILLNYAHPDSPANAILQHPNYNPACPAHLSAFNTGTTEGLAWFKAWMEFLADRYSQPAAPHGRICNFIVGNEVNAHWDWANMGEVPMDQFARDYERTVRVAATAVKKFSSSGRVFISLEHDWNGFFAEANFLRGFAARPFIDYFNDVARSGGNFDWNLAFHPYPEDLFQPRTWLDKSATDEPDSPRITFKNIELLTRYFARDELRFREIPRHIILSEQGFHAVLTPEGEQVQAAAYCYAWRKIVNLKGIDSFILHRHVDNAGEYGLNLGLWRRDPKSTATPMTKRPMYEVFRLADTPQWEQAFKFALPIIGIKSWQELDDKN